MGDLGAGRNAAMMTRNAEGRDRSFVGFEIGGVLYAVDITDVREILRPLPTLPLPHVPNTVVGVIDHRGDVVPIIDLRVRFGFPAGEGRGVRWIIVSRGERFAGLVVDRVTEVFSAGQAMVREVPEIEAGHEERGIVAAYSYRGRLVFVLESENLTAIADALDLRQLASPERGADG